VPLLFDDPEADRIVFWDNSVKELAPLSLDASLAIIGPVIAVNTNIPRKSAVETISAAWTFTSSLQVTSGQLKLNYFAHNGSFTATLSAARTWEMPNSSGTVALTSDIPETATLTNVYPPGLIVYNYDDVTSSSTDPGWYSVRFNNSNPANVTFISFDDWYKHVPGITSGTATAHWFRSALSGGANKCFITVRSNTDNSFYAIYKVTGYADLFGFYRAAVTYVTGTGSFPADDTDLFFGIEPDYAELGGGSVPIVCPDKIAEHEGDTNTYLEFPASDQFRVVTGNVERLEVNNSGVVTSVNITAPDVTATSDLRLKKSAKTLNSEECLKAINALRPCEFTWRKTGEKDTGLIAQEVAFVLPERVYHDEARDEYSVSYAKLTTHLIGAVKALTARVKELEERLDGITNI